jgi:hypothetical protein
VADFRDRGEHADAVDAHERFWIMVKRRGGTLLSSTSVSTSAVFDVCLQFFAASSVNLQSALVPHPARIGVMTTAPRQRTCPFPAPWTDGLWGRSQEPGVWLDPTGAGRRPVAGAGGADRYARVWALALHARATLDASARDCCLSPPPI